MREVSDSWLSVLSHLLESARKDLEAAQFVQGASQLETSIKRMPYLHMALERSQKAVTNLEEFLQGR
jgi:hypothetical protein